MSPPHTPNDGSERRRRITRTLVVLVAVIVIGYMLGIIYWPDLMPGSR